MTHLFQKMTIVLVLLGTLVGCAREPMIRLNEENQSMVDQKRKAREMALNESKDQLTPEESGATNKPTNITSTTLSPNPNPIDLKTDTWTVAPEGMTYLTTDFIPLMANEIRSFTNGQAVDTWYALYYRPERGQLQILSIASNEEKWLVYRWDQNQINKALMESENNRYREVDPWSEGFFVPILQAPLSKGMQWEMDGVAATISQVYSQAQVKDQTYADVLEVSYGDNKEYYAKGVGLIAYSGPEGTWVLSSRSQSVMLITPKTLPLPNPDRTSLLSDQSVNIGWQTNDQLARSLTQVFRDQKLIGPNISINTIQVDSGLTVIDFTPGVVATLNAFPQGEKVAIATIVAILNRLTGENQVMITVNGLVMAPDTLPVPPNGIYTYNPEWMTVFAEDPFNMASVAPENAETGAEDTTVEVEEQELISLEVGTDTQP